MNKRKPLFKVVLFVFGALLPLACSAPGGPGAFPDEPPVSVPVGARGTAPLPVAEVCKPARASEILTARSSTINAAGASKASTMFTQDLFGIFRSHCGACHVDAAQGNFGVTPSTFRTKIDDLVVATIKSEDSAKFMPPPAAGGKPFSQRKANDPVVELVKLMEQWKAQGKPADLFKLNQTSESSGAPKYSLPADVGGKLTNLGNCIPPAKMFASQAPAMDDIDARFAAATALPDTLDKTDLVSFDSAELAQRGLVAYVPTYPLWTDSAGKLRYVRVPRGQTVKFNKEKQGFEIPRNTRFYKTFLKKVIDLSGKETFRKLETRVIVSRPETIHSGGARTINSLFGTYIWNDDETKAELLRDPLRNGEPFRDRLITYVQDELKAKKIIDSKPSNLTFALNDENPELLRHYAIPGSQRCIDCHMGGSKEAAFVLGFSPLQLNRRAQGTGGTYEHTGEDELNQLQRLIDYGIITGIGSMQDVKLLEDSQGERKPRNTQELNAQAYMVGNCAHCHNPQGLPSQRNVELKDALDFLPNATTGGIFQFPLERYSSVRKRGAGQDVPMPYITPSLVEYPVPDSPLRNGNWVPKSYDCRVGDATQLPWQCVGETTFVVHLKAPWRSLLYRNVDTPFTYTDDFAIFPHMPMHSTSFDCRAPRIMADWMISIPAKRKRPDINEWNVPNSQYGTIGDNSPQPYEEVLATADDYGRALMRVDDRLEQWHSSEKYKLCPPDLDIVDRKILKGGGAPGSPLVPEDSDIRDKNDAEKVIMDRDGVPDRSHFIVTDLTDAPGDWQPRNGSWKKVLVEGTGPDKQKEVAEVLQTVRVTEELRSLALTPVPFGLWQEKPECSAKLGRIPTISSVPANQRPLWMTEARPSEAAKIYMQSPGEAVFNTICRNCHGPSADSRGILAQAILEMTGGEARVANFRDGILGPTTMIGNNRMRAFGAVATPMATAEDWAARYMSWMALGGTERNLPSSLLNIVAVTGVLGQQRLPNKLAAVGSPNMLKLAQDLCLQVLTANEGNQAGSLDGVFATAGRIDWGNQTALIAQNADAEMWLRLCSTSNRRVVRVPLVDWNSAEIKPDSFSIDPVRSLYFSDGYPADADVLDHTGKLQKGVRTDNLFPICIAKPDAKFPALVEKAKTFLNGHPAGGVNGAVIPFCPPELFPAGDPERWRLKSTAGTEGTPTDFVGRRTWATKGAANAGVAVFLYVDQLVKSGIKPQPEYNHCQDLSP